MGPNGEPAESVSSPDHQKDLASARRFCIIGAGLVLT